VSSDFERSRRRSTIVSPWFPGRIEARTSTSRPSIARPMRPSCGLRFSAMSIAAMIFRRETAARARCAGMLGDVAQHAVDAVAHAHAAVPGSTWMSLARISSASRNMRVTRRMIGASGLLAAEACIERATSSSPAAP
jgi:hypothetical protein